MFANIKNIKNIKTIYLCHLKNKDRIGARSNPRQHFCMSIVRLSPYSVLFLRVTTVLRNYAICIDFVSSARKDCEKESLFFINLKFKYNEKKGN